MAAGRWSLVAGRWSLVAGRWSLVAGRWSLVKSIVRMVEEYRFEKLRVYKDAMELVVLVYSLCKKLPNEEKYSLSDQLRRAAVSVVLNIAEGSGSLGDVEYKSFLRISLKSLYETIAALKIAERLFKVEIAQCLQKGNVVGKELNALIKSLSRSR